MTAGWKVQEIVHLIMRRTEARRGVEALEAEHRTGTLLHLAVILLQQVISVARRPVCDGRPKLKPDGPGVGTVTVRGNPQGTPLADHPRGTEECASGGEVTGLAQADI